MYTICVFALLASIMAYVMILKILEFAYEMNKGIVPDLRSKLFMHYIPMMSSEDATRIFVRS